MPNQEIILQKRPQEVVTKEKKDLKRAFAEIDSRNKKIESATIIDQNKLRKTKMTLINRLFEMMKELGVDPNNLESINKFLATLSQQDPDLVQLFEVAFSSLASDKDVTQQAPAPVEEGASSGLMDRFSNLGQEKLMPR